MILRLHRSLAFWLGLPAFLFLFWGWQDSKATGTWLQAGPIDVISGRNLIVLRSDRDRQQFDFDRFPLRDVVRPWLLEEPGFHHKKGLYYEMQVNDRWLGIPYWLTILLYSIAWAVVIRWRDQCRQKMLESIFAERLS
jgi:hypothetical protein